MTTEIITGYSWSPTVVSDDSSLHRRTARFDPYRSNWRPLDWTLSTRLSTSTVMELQTSDFSSFHVNFRKRDPLKGLGG